jgi:hypothetical protein
MDCGKEDGACRVRDYGKVLPAFWTGDTGRLLRDAGRDAQLVALYLLTGPSANMIGLYHLPLPLLCHHLGLKPEGALKALQRVVDTGFAGYEAASETIFVPHMARVQIGESLLVKDNRHKFILKELKNWRKSLFVKEFCAIYGSAYSLPDDIYIEAPYQAPLKPLRSHEHEHEHEQDTPKPPEGDCLPEALNNEAFQTTLADWIAYKGKKYKPQGMKALISRAATLAHRHGLPVVIEAFRTAMANGWQGWDQASLFEKAPLRTEARLPDIDESRKTWVP